MASLCSCFCAAPKDEDALSPTSATKLEVAPSSAASGRRAPESAYEDEEDDNDEVEEKSSYDTLLEMATSLWQTAAAYLRPEEVDEYKKEHDDNLKRMNTLELREHVIAEKHLNKAVETVMEEESVGKTDVARAMRGSLRIDDGSVVFDGDLFAGLLSSSLDESTGEVNAQKFIQASNMVPLLMGGLGRTFEFANSDLLKKMTTAQQRMEETADELGKDIEEVTLQEMVERDIRNGTTHAGKKAAPAARTILRLMWFLDFIGALLTGVARNQDKPLKTICSKVYEDTLAPRHIWILRKAARSGMGLLPGKDVFRKRLGTYGMSEAAESEALERWAKDVVKVAEVMWAYMGSKGLETLP